MSRIKLIFSTLLVLVFLATQVGAVQAAPAGQEAEPVTGIIQSIAVDSTNEPPTVQVVFTDGTSVSLSLDTALAQALVSYDPDGNLIVNDALYGEDFSIDPSAILPEEIVTSNPVAKAISAFFASVLGLDTNTVAAWHADGYGFGVITQACWMSNELGGDASTCGDILAAKKSGDYSAFTLPDGSEPTNWGQFKKAVHDNKGNLGAIMSGKGSIGQDDSGQTLAPALGNGHGNNKDKSNNGKAKGKNK
jgi:hypothetical protein